SGLFAQVNSPATGAGGNLLIETEQLIVREGGQVSVGTFGQGSAGNLEVIASDSVQVLGQSTNGISSGLFADTQDVGDGRDLKIITGRLIVRDGAVVVAGTGENSQGNGGNLEVFASESVQLSGSGSGLYVQADPGSSGKAGNLTINTDTLLVQDGAQVSAATFGTGDGGNLEVNAAQSVQVIGRSADGRVPSGLFAQAEQGSSGKAGDLRINTGTLLVQDGAQVTVSSPSGQAGNMTIKANSLLLNQGRLFAETAKSSPEGGANITLIGLDLLRMDNESLISANALEDANGGNVTIDSTFIVATPPTGSKGSDITANAVRGNGGRVNITTQGLLGIEFRPQLTPKNDITVSSEFGFIGDFQLNSPDVDPSRGLAQLPTNIVDASEQIDRRCTPARSTQERNSFTITGRGGLPPSPHDPLQSESIITNWVTLDSDVETKTAPVPINPKSSTPKPLVEAQGWMLNQKGDIVLTASALTATPQGEWFPEAECNDPSVQSQ
ncbi:MAG TPA: S-layer family protein, partial [Stenomitos sp.]